MSKKMIKVLVIAPISGDDLRDYPWQELGTLVALFPAITVSQAKQMLVGADCGYECAQDELSSYIIYIHLVTVVVKCI